MAPAEDSFRTGTAPFLMAASRDLTAEGRSCAPLVLHGKLTANTLPPP